MRRAPILLAILLSGCTIDAVFRCLESEQCRGSGGFCEPVGYCSFDDGACPSGRRYDDNAGAGLGGACVGSGGQECVLAEIATGVDTSCARRANGRVACWGSNVDAALTNALPAGVPIPTLLALQGVDQIALGETHACARSGGAVSCWGSNAEAGASSGDPAPVAGLSGVSSVAVGESHSCATTAPAGEVWCWGRGVEGQLGDAMGASSTTPVRVRDDGGSFLSGAAGVALGQLHSCAWSGSGAAWCWGENQKGQLGIDSMADVDAAWPVVGLTGVAEMAAGSEHTCARLAGGEVRCWGENTSGQTGDGSMGGHRLTPVATALGSQDAVALGSGQYHTCAVMTDASLWCWGADGGGQLGDGTVGPDQAMPQRVPGIDDARGVAGGGAHTCALVGDAAVSCWGANISGQLGDGTTSPHATPSSAMVTCPP